MIIHPKKNISITIPKPKSYDPAGETAVQGNSEVLSNSQHNFILAFCSIELNAAASGVSEAGLNVLFSSMHNYISLQVGKIELLE